MRFIDFIPTTLLKNERVTETLASLDLYFQFLARPAYLLTVAGTLGFGALLMLQSATLFDFFPRASMKALHFLFGIGFFSIAASQFILFLRRHLKRKSKTSWKRKLLPEGTPGEKKFTWIYIFFLQGTLLTGLLFFLETRYKLDLSPSWIPWPIIQLHILFALFFYGVFFLRVYLKGQGGVARFIEYLRKP